MDLVNAVDCEPDDTFGRGAFCARVLELTERLGANVIGATIWEMQPGEKGGPYHFHHGVEEWLYVVSGAPILRDPEGERKLEPGELVAFPSGPAGAHTLTGPGRVVIFSVGDRGWGEAFVTVYPDSDKIAAAPGVMFRLADAIATSTSEGVEASMSAGNQMALGGQGWTATVYELAPGEATAPYRYEWCREEWALVVSGAPTLRHADGQTALRAGDVCCFPQGPGGARQLRNDSDGPARLIGFSTSAERPMSAFYPDHGTVLISVSGRERLLFRNQDQIEDYWDGEPGAG